MISIIIPCYNAGEYIHRCIFYLKQQTYPNFNVIFVDDCSIDNTKEILIVEKAKLELNMTIIHNDKNYGPGISRNKGIMYASSKYITFCDCDDWYEPNYLETMVTLLESNNADIAFCGYKVVDEHGNSKLRPIYYKSGIISRNEAFALDADSLCMMMVKTDIMQKCLLPDLRNGEDVATIPMLMVKSFKYAVTDKCLYNYFRRSGSASEKPTINVVDSLLSSFEYTKKKFPYNYHKELEFLGIKNVLYSSLITLFSIGYNKEKASEILNSFEHDFPEWRNNPYLHNLRFYKKLIVILASRRYFMVIRLVAILRNTLFK